MNPFFAPMAREAITIPSSTAWGSPSNSARSMNAPGSPSSALQTRYFSSPAAEWAISHFTPVGNPAPPRPRSPERLTVSMTSSGDISHRAFAAAA